MIMCVRVCVRAYVRACVRVCVCAIVATNIVSNILVHTFIMFHKLLILSYNELWNVLMQSSLCYIMRLTSIWVIYPVNQLTIQSRTIVPEHIIT